MALLACPFRAFFDCVLETFLVENCDCQHAKPAIFELINFSLVYILGTSTG